MIGKTMVINGAKEEASLIIWTNIWALEDGETTKKGIKERSTNTGKVEEKVTAGKVGVTSGTIRKTKEVDT
jgi:hypothetical protein